MAAVAGAILGMGSAGAAEAAPVTLCMKPGAPVVAPASSGACAAGYTASQTASEADLKAARTRIAALEAKLRGVTRTGNTLRVSGANLQLVNGGGATHTRNGLGNLIVGYNESPGVQTGSHNVVVGTHHTATSYAGIVGGFANSLTGAYSTALGYATTAAGRFSLTAGDRNQATGLFTSATGGSRNTAASEATAVTGGMLNTARTRWSAVTGGCGGLTDRAATSFAPAAEDCHYRDADANPYVDGEFAAITGGLRNLVTGEHGVASGGYLGNVEGVAGAITGGYAGVAEGEYSAVSGGFVNTARGESSSVTGGYLNVAAGRRSAILGGRGWEVKADYGTHPE